MSGKTWPSLAQPPALEAGAIHLWLLNLEPEQEFLDGVFELLSPDEQARAARFRFERDRDHFVAGRSQLRLLVGRYLGEEPASLRFGYGVRGKPYVDGESGGLEFNLAHSGRFGLLAVGRDCDIGVDIEHTGREVAIEEVARRFFAVEELAALHRLNDAEKRRGFYRCWTRKEAFIKAIGEGLAFGLDQFGVSLGADKAEVIQIEGDTKTASEWRLSHIEPHPDYVGAVAWRWLNVSTGFVPPLCFRFRPLYGTTTLATS